MNPDLALTTVHVEHMLLLTNNENEWYKIENKFHSSILPGFTA